jgi:LacI family transcriptional regulator
VTDRAPASAFSGELEMPVDVRRQRPVTIKDVARTAGVHPSTVSRSLDPTHTAISAGTRDRVLQAARTLGYRPDILASGFRRRRSRTIGVVIPDFGNPIYGQLIRGITLQLEREGYVALIVETRDRVDRLDEALETLSARRVDGIITAATRERDVRILRKVARRGIPIVMAVRWVRESNAVHGAHADRGGGPNGRPHDARGAVRRTRPAGVHRPAAHAGRPGSTARPRTSRMGGGDT